MGILATLLSETVAFFSQVSFWEFFTETRWTPLFSEKHFGILPLLAGSIQVALGASLLAVPVGLLSAIFLSEYAGTGLRAVIRPLLGFMAGIPTVVYGYFALTFVTPAIRRLAPETEAFNAASASMVLALMILPTVACLSEEALRSVPNRLKQAAVGLGASRIDVTLRVVVPAGLPGVVGSVLLALSRALGETMVVTIAAGNSPVLTLNPLEAIQTMTAYLVQVGTGAVPGSTLEYRTLFVVGMSLFMITAILNWTGFWVRSRLRGGGHG
jgi:phosphate transport system permease protein